MQSGEIVAEFGVDGPIMDCAVTPDGKTIVVGMRTGQVHFLRLEGIISGKCSDNQEWEHLL